MWNPTIFIESECLIIVLQFSMLLVLIQIGIYSRNYGLTEKRIHSVLEGSMDITLILKPFFNNSVTC